MSQEIKCPCCEVKTVAKERDGKIYVWCKQCKQEVELIIIKESHSHEREPRNKIAL